MGDGRILLKTHATIPLKKSYRMSLISAGSISLDSTFKSADFTKLLFVALRKMFYTLRISDLQTFSRELLT